MRAPGRIGLLLAALAATAALGCGESPAPPGDCVRPVSGMVIRKDTVLCAGTWELPGSDDPRIRIVADGATLSCRPGTVLDGVTNRGVGVGNRRLVRPGEGANGVTIRGCALRRFDRGIEIVPGSRDAAIVGNTLTDIRGQGDSGIAILVGGTNLSVRNNRIADAGHGGVIALGLRFGVIEGNEIVNSKCSITLRDGSSFNRVTRNRLVNASEWGTALGMAGKDGAFSEHNSIVGNDYRTDPSSPGRMRVGIMLLDHSRYTAIVANTMTGVAMAGIASALERRGPHGPAAIVGNALVNAGFDGGAAIHVTEGAGLTVAENRIAADAGLLPPGIWKGPAVGIELFAARGANVARNVVTGLPTPWITLDEASRGVVIDGNEVRP